MFSRVSKGEGGSKMIMIARSIRWRRVQHGPNILSNAKLVLPNNSPDSTYKPTV